MIKKLDKSLYAIHLLIVESNLREFNDFRRPLTVAIIANSVFNLFTAEPIPTPVAPTDIAIGIVISESPDAQIKGTYLLDSFKAVVIEQVAAKVGDSTCVQTGIIFHLRAKD